MLKNICVIVSVLSSIVGILLLPISAIFYSRRAQKEGKNTDEIPVFYAFDYNALERRIAIVGVILIMMGIIGLIVSDQFSQ